MKHDTTGEIIDPGLDLSSQTSKAAIPEVDIDVRWTGSLSGRCLDKHGSLARISLVVDHLIDDS
jgi:hypothetical protein